MKPKSSPEDIELFRRTVGKVKPLQQGGVVPAPRRRASRARSARVDPLAMVEESLADAVGDEVVASGDALSYSRPGVPRSVLRKLRRGDYPVDAELDLHGLTMAQATKVLGAFLAGALGRHAACVRIIHGKGLRSGQRGPVLKNVVNTVLSRTPAVIAYVSARPGDGGTGAAYVLLSQRT